MTVVTKSKVQYRVKADPFVGDERYELRYKGRDYSMGFRRVKDKLSYQLVEEYWDESGLVGASEFYTSHNTFTSKQSALKDAAMTIQEMEDWQSWAESGVDADHEAMIDSYR